MLMTALRPNDADPDLAARTMARAVGYDLALFDDLGRENLSEFVIEQMQTILDQRATAGLRSIITTNLTGDKVERRYGSPIADRIEDDATIVRFTGPSRRAAHAAY